MHLLSSGADMRRREFIGLTRAAAAWPFAARAQQTLRPLVAVLSPLSATTAVRNINAYARGSAIMATSMAAT